MVMRQFYLVVATELSFLVGAAFIIGKVSLLGALGGPMAMTMQPEIATVS